MASVIRDSAGNFYGTTASGGKSNAGTVFTIDKNGVEKVLWPFTGAGGLAPEGRLLLDAAGNLYGTTDSGGKSQAGLVFKLTP
jgi:uncharacterized repeat protein (TIGR03803 family)